MIRTPEQAAEAWCRHARVVRDEESSNGDIRAFVGGVNRDAMGRIASPASCRCIVAACMSWRWWDPPFLTAMVNPREVRPATLTMMADDGFERHEGADSDGLHCYRRPRPNRKGYCGADGKPVYPE